MSNLTIESILGPLSAADFLSDYWGKRVLRASGDPARFADLLPWAALNRILNEQTLKAPRARLVKEDILIPDSEYHAAGIASHLSNGALLSISMMQDFHPAIRDLAAEFERFFHEVTNVNAYIGFRESKGFEYHWDDHEVFVLQVHGRKRWEVQDRSTAAPLYRELIMWDAAPGNIIWEGVLEPGDVLYIPRGFWHKAECGDEPSVHLSFGVDVSTGIDLLQWLARELRASELYRTDLPRFESPQARRERSRQLRSELVKLFSDDTVDRYFAAADRDATNKVQINLPESVTLDPDSTWVRWNTPRPTPLGLEQGLGRFVTADCLGENRLLPKKAQKMLHLIADGGALLSDLIAVSDPELNPGQVCSFVSKWASEGMVAIETAGRPSSAKPATKPAAKMPAKKAVNKKQAKRR